MAPKIQSMNQAVPTLLKNKVSNEEESKFFGHYRVEKMLGKGSYGKVKLATNLKTNQKVALKFILKSSIKKEAHLTRIKREVRLLKLLNHPNIVRLYEASETNQEIILTMEHASGGELFDYIVAQKRVKEPEARRLFRQIISAVDYCHQNCVIHRDLKPENLLLDSQRNIKIIDFGFANTFDPDGLLGTFCGSPYYASPEMITGQKYIGPEVDIWSLGVILYALLCGCLPFEEEHMKELYAKIMAGKYTIPSHVSLPAKELIQKMIVVDPKARATINEIKSHKWICDGFDAVESLLPNRPILTELDENIIQKLLTYGYEKETLKKKILNEPRSPAFCAYYLVKERIERESAKVLEEEKEVRKEISKLSYEEQEEQKSASSSIPSSFDKADKISAYPDKSLNTLLQSPAASYKPSGRRFSLDGAANFAVHTASTIAQKFRKPKELKKEEDCAIPTVNGLFNVSTTSTKPPSQISVEVVKVLNQMQISFTQHGYSFLCLEGAGKGMIKFEIEICKIDRLDLYGLNLKRVEGDSWNYKKLCVSFTNQLKL